MTFARAKPGGYTDDVDVLPADEIDTIDVNQSRAADMNAGGTYTPSSPFVVNGSGIASDNIGNSTLTGTLTAQGDISMTTGDLIMVVGSNVQLSVGTVVTAGTDNVTFDPDSGIVRQQTAPGAPRDHDIVAAGNTGRLFHYIKTGGSAVVLRRSGFSGDDIVALATGWASATLYDDGTDWRLFTMFNGTAGPDA